jgi:hypothetical protein
MAITDIGKLFESTSTTDPKTHTLGLTIKAGTLICMALGGTRSGSNLDISSITDSKGNTWDWRSYPSTTAFAAVAWTRVGTAMTTSDTVTVNWNGSPSVAWVSAHGFENASGTPTDEGTGTGFGSTASVTLDVTGSDWLAFGTMSLPSDFGVDVTAINSGTLQDDNARASAAPWCECVSRNGTTGSTYSVGGSFTASLTWRMAGVTFPYEALPTGGRGQPFLIGV